MDSETKTHSVLVGYVLWIFGIFGAHRFYYGRTVSGIIWFFTGGLFLVGWIVDLFLIPSMERRAGRLYHQGRVDYTVAWVLQTFLGYLGIHRFYMGKIWTGLLFMCTGGLFFIGYVYDYCTLNEQISERNKGR